MNYRLIIDGFKPMTIKDCLIDDDGYVFGTGKFIGGRNRLYMFPVGDAAVDGTDVYLHPVGNPHELKTYKINYAEFYLPDQTRNLLANIVFQPV